MKILGILSTLLALAVPLLAQPLIDDDGRRDPYTGLDPRRPRTGNLDIDVSGASRKGIGRINDRDVSFVWLHQQVRKNFIGFRVKLTMMPRFGSGGVDKRASLDPLDDVEVEAYVGDTPLRQAYMTRMAVTTQSDRHDYTVNVPKTEYRWKEIIKPDGSRERVREPYTVYVNESRSTKYDFYVGEFDVIFEAPSNPSPDAQIEFDIRYGKAKQKATWTWSQFTRGGWVDVGDRDPDRGPRPSNAIFAILPVQAARGVDFRRVGEVQDDIDNFIRTRRGSTVGMRKLDRAADALRLDLGNPRSLRDDDFLRLGKRVEADYVVFMRIDDLYGDSVTLSVWIADVRSGEMVVDGRHYIGRDHDQDDAIRMAVENALRPYLTR